MDRRTFASYIDHTLLKPDATETDILRICAEAKQYGFAAVCIPPCYVGLAASQMADAEINVCTVIGFPLGYSSMQTKIYEAKQAVLMGANEIDMVINISALKSKNPEPVEREIRNVKDLCGPNTIVKAILETCLLTDEEKTLACVLAKRAGADYVKTSTGFASGGATVEDIALLRRIVGPEMGVKASGGIRTLASAMALIEAGATRIGASASIGMIEAL